MSPSYRVMRLSAPDWEKVPAISLSHTGWLPPCAVSARAQLCHDGQTLFVRMEAEETAIRATLTGKLDQVCNDSCLEFFFAPQEGDPRYFNFELNPLGTLYLGFGAERPTRVRQIVKDAQALFHPAPFSTENGWGITFCIPLSFLRLYFPDYTFHTGASCNFYKCGDQTQTVHYLAWAPLHSETPDYHRRSDFGTLIFE